MTCNNTSSNPDDQFLNLQEHRNISRLWKSAVHKLSQMGLDLNRNFLSDDVENYNEDEGKREVHFERRDNCEFFGQNPCEGVLEAKTFPAESVQKKIAKGKSITKIKSPLQKFDEVVTKELTNRRMSEDGGMSSFEGSKKWSCLQFTGKKLSDFGRGKISVENKVSRGVLHSVKRDVIQGDPSDVQNATLMDAIEKLAQAQAFCRFDAAVKAAEAATASVPPEKAEEVAVACAKDYQSEIVDVINEKIPLSEEKKPMEVIGYIGVTKLKENF